MKLSNHALQRLEQRFFAPNSTKQAEDWVVAKLKHAKFLGIQIDERGNPGRFFVAKGVTLVLDQDVDHVVTIMSPSNAHKGRYHKKVTDLVLAEFAKSERKLTRDSRRNEVITAELELEKAQLGVMLVRAKSEARKMALQARINAVQMRIDELPGERFEIKRELARYAQGVTAYV
jgi:hypothetical protein